MRGSAWGCALTGYNHYAGCLCGWCVGATRGSAPHLASLHFDDARRLLKSANVRSVSGCFVKPNARCPVCHAHVFYYANSQGSRVFFDDLGPPWPKHPCTNTVTYGQQKSALAYGSVLRRSKGEITELIEAANLTGLAQGKKFGNRQDSEWTLSIISKIIRTDRENTIICEYIDSENNENWTLKCFSDENFFTEDSFIFSKGSLHSYYCLVSMRDLKFKTDSDIDKFQTLDLKPAAQMPTIPAQVFQELKKLVRRSKWEHFMPIGNTVTYFLDNLSPKIDIYKRQGARDSKSIANKLNKDRIKTGCGETWTASLVFSLLKLISFRSKITHSNSSKSTSTAPLQTTTVDAAIEKSSLIKLTHEELVRKLSRLGRIRDD